MLDNVQILIPLEEGSNWLMSSAITRKVQWKDGFSYSGYLKNLKIKLKYSGVTITGSLPKYLNGENITPLTREQIKEGFELLQEDTGIDLSKGLIRSIEWGSSFIMKYPPFYYLNNFGEKEKSKSSYYYGKQNNLETVEYFTKKGSYTFRAYDKIQEMKDKKKQNKIPEPFNDCHVLRL